MSIDLNSSEMRVGLANWRLMLKLMSLMAGDEVIRQH